MRDLGDAVAVGVAQQRDAVGARRRRRRPSSSTCFMTQPLTPLPSSGLRRRIGLGDQHVAVRQHVEPARMVEAGGEGADRAGPARPPASRRRPSPSPARCARSGSASCSAAAGAGAGRCRRRPAGSRSRRRRRAGRRTRSGREGKRRLGIGVDRGVIDGRHSARAPRPSAVGTDAAIGACRHCAPLSTKAGAARATAHDSPPPRRSAARRLRCHTGRNLRKESPMPRNTGPFARPLKLYALGHCALLLGRRRRDARAPARCCRWRSARRPA